MSETSVPRLLGAVLVGGRSTRLGRPKWSERLDGMTMALRAARALSPHVRAVVAVASPAVDPGGDVGLPLIYDAAADRGPLAAVVAALAHAQAGGDVGCVVLACDLPLVDEALVGAVVRRWSNEQVVAPERSGRLQPLCAVWSVDALPAARQTLATEHRSVARLAERLVLRRVAESEWRADSPDGDPLLNVNTEEDLTRAAELIQQRGSLGGRRGS